MDILTCTLKYSKCACRWYGTMVGCGGRFFFRLFLFFFPLGALMPAEPTTTTAAAAAHIFVVLLGSSVEKGFGLVPLSLSTSLARILNASEKPQRSRPGVDYSRGWGETLSKHFSSSLLGMAAWNDFPSSRSSQE